jgi:hypothetical protein
MEAAREGHEEMVALLLAHGKLFNYIFHTVNDIVLMFLIKVLNTLIKLS